MQDDILKTLKELEIASDYDEIFDFLYKKGKNTVGLSITLSKMVNNDVLIKSGNYYQIKN